MEKQYISPETWREYIRSNADYFTTVRFRPFRRYEFLTFEDALGGARVLVKHGCNENVLIYAVSGVHDCWVATVNKDGLNEGRKE